MVASHEPARWQRCIVGKQEAAEIVAGSKARRSWAALGPAGSCQADVVHRAASAYRGGGDLVEGGALRGIYGEHAVEQRDERP